MGAYLAETALKVCKLNVFGFRLEYLSKGGNSDSYLSI